jgi:cytochrome b6-f complex iron-sulfur subunit
MDQLNRREFVAAVACAACLCGLGNAAHLLADEPTTGPTTLDVGPKSDYTTDGITTTWMKVPNRVAVIRHDGKIYACTTICTHKGGTLNKAADDESFVCPNHHAMFDIEGNVTHKPAKRPLIRYAISVDGDGHVIVDKSTSFTAEQWNDPASFVKVD